MPYTMNGIGTWYYGKGNLFSYTDFCPHCNRHVKLSSYDTREWFVIVFIPIIPLGRKRIMDACPICTKHRQLPLKKYLQAKSETYAKAEQALRDKPNDPDIAGQLLQAYAAYQDMPRFDSEAPQFLQHFPDNHKLLNTVGMIHFQYGRMEEARDYLEQSLLLCDDDDIRLVLGMICARLSDSDAAALYFQFILDKSLRDKAGALFALVDAYQAQGRHREALTCLDQMVRLDPDMERNKEFKKSKKLSEKNLASGKPLKSKQLISPQKVKTPVSGKKAWGIAAMVCLAIGLFVSGISFFMSLRANVYLVNGLNRSYEVTLAGKTFRLPESGFQKIAVPEGTLALTVADADLHIQPSSLSLHSPFWKRPFLDRVYIINPDAIALVEWNKVYYHENTNKAPDPEWQVYYGKQLHVFDGVHFPFENFPDEISMSHPGAEARVQVKLLDKTGFSPYQIPQVIEQLFGFETKIDYLKKALCYEPDNLVNLHNLYAQADTATFIESIRPGLDVVPPRVEWHRLYQAAMETTKPQYDLAAEYKARLEKAPNDAGLQYLYGRTFRQDRQQAQYWFERSIQNPKPLPYGYFALGYDAMAVADFRTALEHFRKAMQLVPDHPYFCDFCYDMLVATSQLDKAEEFCRAQVAQKTSDYKWMQEYISVLRQQDKFAQAQQEFEQWCRRNSEVFSEEDFSVLRRSDRLNTAYLAGDFNAVREIIGEPNDISDKMLLTLHGNKPISHDMLAQADSFPPMWLLLCYIFESRLGNEQDAALFLAEASKRFQQGAYEDRCIAQCLEPGARPDPETICALLMERDIKAVTLTALGIRFPEYRNRFFELAGRLNFKKVFPYHFLNSVHKDESLQKPAPAPGTANPI